MATRVTRIHIDTATLDRLQAHLVPGAEMLVKAAAFQVQALAAQKAPVDTSALANSIIAVRRGQMLWRVQDGVHYGIYQELGFHHWRSGAFIQNPFMVPAVEEVKPQFFRSFGALLDPI